MSEANNYLPDDNRLQAIAAHHGLGVVREWQTLAGGVVNPILLLNNSVVLRFNRRDVDEPKIPKEAWVLRFLAGQELPGGCVVPRVLGLDTSRSLMPYDYILLEYMAGVPGGELWERWDAPRRAQVSWQLGNLLAALHSLELPGTHYGHWDPARAALGTGLNWRVMMSRRNGHLLEQARRLNLLDGSTDAAVERWLADNLVAIPEQPERVLTHGDFHVINTLIKEEGALDAPQVAVLLDFEWAQAGPPGLDFAPLLFDPSDPIEPTQFLAGYSAGRPIDAGLLRESFYYQMQYHLDLLGVVHKFWGGQGGDAFHAAIAGLLRSEVPWGFREAGYQWPAS